MSDQATEVAAPAAPAPDAAPVADSSAPATPSPAEAEAAPKQDGEQPPKPARTFTQDELEHILGRERAKTERRAERIGYERAMREAAERQLRELTAPKDAPRQPAEGKPTPEQFKTYDEFTEALADWKVEQRFRERGKQQEQEQQQRVAESERIEAVKSLAPALERYPDFEEVALGDHVTVTPMMGRKILKMGAEGHDVLYYLGQNPRESERIARLDVLDQVEELSKLAAKLKPQPKATTAPPPIKPNEGTATVERRLEEADYDEYVKIRRRQVAARR